MIPQPVITVRGLKHVFGDGPGRREVLHGISTDFYPGEIVIITGPSGAGKTTFLTLIGALRTIQEGTVAVEGRDLASLGAEDRAGTRRKIGFIFQAHNLIDALTASQNVQMAFLGGEAIPAAEARRRALEALGDVGLAEYADSHPRKLSGGQKQRVAIARALVRKPRILLADEPTAALDGKTGREVVDILRTMARKTGCAILLVTHDNRILDIADRVIRIEDGSMEETHLGLERLLGGLDRLIRMLPPLLSPAAGGRPAGAAVGFRDPAFSAAAAELRLDLTSLAGGRLPEHLRRRLEAIEELAGAMTALEEALSDLLRLSADPSAPRLAGLIDVILQSSEFLLLAGVDAFASRSEEDILLLQSMTADRGGAMNELRERHFSGLAGLDESGQALLFDLTNTFARFVHFLNKIGLHLGDAVRGKPV